MFNLSDFPIGSNFYWVRQLAPFETSIIVYTKMTVSGHDEEGNLIYTHYFDVKNSQPFYVRCEKEKYLYPSHSFYIPELLFDIIRNPKQVVWDEKAKLMEIFLSGHHLQNEMIKNALCSFKELDEATRNQANRIRMKDVINNKELAQNLLGLK